MTRSNRDDFPDNTKRALALRAAYRCSFDGCSVTTCGPSDESPSAVASIGEAAHIHAAAPGGRRYLSSMTSEERADIANGIWLCVTHSRLIDRDEVMYTAENLRRMKRDHERRVERELSGRSGGGASTDFIALGPNVVAVGNLAGTSGVEWRLNIEHFVVGDVSALIRFGESFDSIEPYHRYVLVNELGDGRELDAAPEWEKVQDGYLVRCRVRPATPRISAHALPSDLALDDSINLFVVDGDIAMVSGLSALPQKISMALSIQRGERWFYPSYGSLIKEYRRLLSASAWLPRLVRLETIRMACIPYADASMSQAETPLQCVNRVLGVELQGDATVANWLPFRFELEVEGVGVRTETAKIYISPGSENELA